MERQIVDIEYDDGTRCIARIIKDLGTELQISTLEYHGYETWKFSEELEIVPRESISGFYDTMCLDDTGLFEQLKNGMYATVDPSDTEYEPDFGDSDSDSDSGSIVSLVSEF
tara:strand:+ start:427 stop:762 length:336 start_codon:yes stop_codon:yes gene_type:complete